MISEENVDLKIGTGRECDSQRGKGTNLGSQKLLTDLNAHI